MTVANQTTTDLSVGLPAINPNGPPPGIATAFADINVSLQSGADVQTLLVAVVSEPPVSFDTFKQLPRKQNIGTFWSMQNPNWPPMPGDMLGLPVWEISAGRFIMDDRNVDYAALQAAADEEAALTAPAPMMRMSLMSSSLATSYAYDIRPYLSNLTASPASDGSMTMNFSISGGTNFLPYDILMTTNLSTPSDAWNWIGMGYTSNRYSFTSQPGALALYGLAKPSKTMVVPWGNDYYGQCDIWYGITNAVQVAGSYAYTLALLNDGTVTGWGLSYIDGWVPTNLVGVAMVACGWNHNAVLLTNGTVRAWGVNYAGVLNVPSNLTNATVISAQAMNTLALRSDGTVVGWGDNSQGQTTVPAGLNNVTAIAAGGAHSLAVSNGFVVAWGFNNSGQRTVPTGLSNVWDVAAGYNHSVALKKDGTVVCWGDNAYGESQVPAGLSNVVAIAAGGDDFNDQPGAYTLALKSDGTLVAWGSSEVVTTFAGMNHVITIAGGDDYALAVRTGPPTPVITLEPADAYQAVDANITFATTGVGLYGVTYQWQTNGVNLSGATNDTLTLTNVQMSQQANYRAVVTDIAGNGSIVSSNASLALVTPPVIVSQSPMPTNQVLGTLYQAYFNLSVLATAPGMNNGFPLHYQWLLNGNNIASANGTNYSFNALPGSTNNYSIIVTNAVGSASAAWQITVTNATINVTNDLLLIYNSNSQDSSNLCAYYLAHRPMVGGANVLPVACDVGEFTTSTNCNSEIVFPVLNWLTNNPTKLPQYVILFYDIPTRLTNLSGSAYGAYGSVGYHLHILRPDWQPFVNYINAGSLADCEAYVDKIAAFGTNGQLIISASAGGYGNTNFVLDNVRHGPGFGDGGYTGAGGVLSAAIPAITNANPSAGITYIDGVETINIPFLPHITNAVNVAGYICWGAHSDWVATMNDGDFPLDGNAIWSGNSGWWIIKTVESFNGKRDSGNQSNFIKWFSPNAFGGTNYSNTPVGGCSNVEEPGLEGGNIISSYFSLWSSGKNFGVCAWNAVNTPFFQVVGDPFVAR